MTDIQVSHETLLALASRLQRITSALDDSAHTVHGYDAAVGSDKVSHALHDFVDNWSQGRKQIADEVKQCSGYLHGAGLSYRTTDQQLAAELSEGGG
jgi:uncharacterized protein YukE